MQLICIWGLVPNIVNSDEWKELMNLLNGSYKPTSADTFAMKHIPHEAVYVWQKQNEILCTINNLTLTFDGNSTWKLKSIYTAHATTPSHETYFLDSHQGSDEQHTTQWVTSKLMKICNSCAPTCLNLICLIITRPFAHSVKVIGWMHVWTAPMSQKQLSDKLWILLPPCYISVMPSIIFITPLEILINYQSSNL